MIISEIVHPESNSVGLNGQQVRADWQGTVTRIRGMSPGDELDLTIQRNGEEQELNAELATWDEAFAARKGRMQDDEAAPASSVPDAELDNTNPVEPKLNDKNDKRGADLDTKTPDVKPKDPTLPEPSQADAPDSATESNDQPKQE